MLTLYYKPGCPYCRRVLATISRLELDPDLKDINEAVYAEELDARGGKLQVPYLIDSDTDTEMYESDVIIAYLEERFEKKIAVTSAIRPRIQVAGGVCLSCEG